MNLLFWKKKYYFLACMASMVGICLLGDLLPVDGRAYTVFDVIWERPSWAFEICGIRQAFDAGLSGLAYTLMPLVSLPFASILSDEKKWRFAPYLKMREGITHYLSHRLAYAIASSAAILAVSVTLFVAVACQFFDTSPELGNPESISGICLYMAGKFAYVLAYGTAVTLLAAFFVCLYNDLYVDLSLAFVVNYICRDIFAENSIIIPLGCIALLCLLLAAMAKAQGGQF